MTEHHQIDLAAFDLKLAPSLSPWPDLTRVIERELLPLVEAALDGWDGDGELERLDIDLGSIAFDGDWRPIRRRFSERLDAELVACRSVLQIQAGEGGRQGRLDHAQLSIADGSGVEAVDQAVIFDVDDLLLELKAAWSSGLGEMSSHPAEAILAEHAPARLDHLRRLLRGDARERPVSERDRALSNKGSGGPGTHDSHAIAPDLAPVTGRHHQAQTDDLHSIEADLDRSRLSLPCDPEILAERLSLGELDRLVARLITSEGDASRAFGHGVETSPVDTGLAHVPGNFAAAIRQRLSTVQAKSALLAYIANGLHHGDAIDLDRLAEKVGASEEKEAAPERKNGARAARERSAAHQSAAGAYSSPSIGRLALAIDSRLIDWPVLALLIEPKPLRDIVGSIRSSFPETSQLPDEQAIRRVAKDLACSLEDVLAIAVVSSVTSSIATLQEEAPPPTLMTIVREQLQRFRAAGSGAGALATVNGSAEEDRRSDSEGGVDGLRAFLWAGEALPGFDLIWPMRHALGRPPSVFRAWFKEVMTPPRDLADRVTIDAALIRLSALSPISLLREIARALAPKTAETLLSIIDYVGDIIIADRLDRTDGHALARRWPALLRYLLDHGDNAKPEGLCRDLIAAFASSEADLTQDLRRICAEDREMASLLGGSGCRALQQVLGITVDDAISVDPDGEGARLMATDIGMTSCAGLVLAAPFLPRLFAMCDLVDRDKFRSKNHAGRAVQLLHRLAYGEDGEERPWSRLACLLSAADASELSPVPLADEEKERIDGLVATMIERWPIIGNTSPEGLRESFLQRPGHLQRLDALWQLDVEERSFDMLLDQLPWSFSIIKYPWMTDPIHVHWR